MPAGGPAGRTREVAPLAGSIAIYGLTMSFQSTTLSLFLADAVHAAPALIGLFFTVRGAVSLVVSQGSGWLSDRLGDRRVMLGVSGAGGVAAGLCLALLREYWLVLVTGAVFLSIGGVAFAQLFAYANEYATARGREVTAFTSVMRSFMSAAWVIGPPFGLFVVARYGFSPLYLATVGLSLATAVAGRWGLRYVRVDDSRARAARPAVAGRRPRRPPRLWLLLGVILVLGTVNQMYGIDVSLYVTTDRHLSAELLGWMAGACAGLEVPVMIVIGRVADRVGKSRLVLAAAALAVVFFCLLPLASSPAALLGLQVLNAAWVGVALSIPMIMVQEETPGGAGASSSLYSTTFTSAVLLAGGITGVAASAVGYRGVFWVCAVLSVLAVAMLLARVRLAPGQVAEDRVTQPRAAQEPQGLRASGEVAS